MRSNIDWVKWGQKWCVRSGINLPAERGWVGDNLPEARGAAEGRSEYYLRWQICVSTDGRICAYIQSRSVETLAKTIYSVGQNVLKDLSKSYNDNDIVIYNLYEAPTRCNGIYITLDGGKRSLQSSRGPEPNVDTYKLKPDHIAPPNLNPGVCLGNFWKMILWLKSKKSSPNNLQKKTNEV